MSDDAPPIDSELFDFVAKLVDHGLMIDRASMGVPDESPASVTFRTVADGVEFLEQTVHLTDYRLGANIALTLLPPPGVTRPQSQVCWLPDITPIILSAWKNKEEGTK